MALIKRPLDFEQSFEMKTKKMRAYSTFEDLSNELYYEIFDYLDGCDLFKAFSKLNIRFENLLTRSLLPLNIKFTLKSQPTLKQNCRNVILPYKHRIISLHLNDNYMIKNFLDMYTIDESFIRLESIVLNEITPQKLTIMLFYFNSLPRLSSLTIQLEEDYYYNLSDMLRLIFRLSSLKYLRISADSEESDIIVPKTINEKTSPIERMILDFGCSIPELTSILQHTPNLQYLSCDRLVEIDDIVQKEEPLILSHLTSISITNCDVDFDEFKPLIKQISSELRILRLKTMAFPSFLNPNRWEKLIKKHMPHLHEFHFDCTAVFDDMDFSSNKPDPDILKQFTSSFWTERHWYFAFEDACDRYKYSIHPPSTTWFGNLGTAPSTKLTISESNAEVWNQNYMDDMKPIFEAIEFTHLKIDCSELFPGLLIQILRSLPKLTSLEVSSLSPLESDSLSFNESEILLFVAIFTRVTKVKLDKMIAIESIHFLMDLCPRMEYLEIHSSKDIDLASIIGCIAINNTARIVYLRCLCLEVPQANEETIKHLENIIHYEKLFDPNNLSFNDYSIKQNQKKIFLNWTLL